MSADRIHRLLRLIMLLQSGQARTVEALAVTLQVSRRTVFRDLKMLEAAGIPCYHDKQQGYRIARTYYLPPINLTISETLGLLLLGKYASAQRKRPFAAAALSAVSKLITTLPEPVREACTQTMAGVSIDLRGQAVDDAEAEHFNTLQRCIDEARVCRVTYKRPVETDHQPYDLRPYALHFASRAWYVVGLSEAHDEVRLFKLARIVAIEPLSRRFDTPKRFRVADKIGNAWQLIAEGREYDIELEFSQRVATNVTEVVWHPTQKHTMLDDGRCRMTFRVDGLNEIAWWICGYADHVRVIAPPELRKKVASMHRAAQEAAE